MQAGSYAQISSHDGRGWYLDRRVFGAIDGCPGVVVAVDASAGTFSVQWADENAVGNVIYPDDTIMVRGAYPWE